MKFLFTVILIGVLLCASSDYSYGLSGPQIEYKGKSWDLGNVEQGKTSSRTFSLYNKGDEELVIEKIHSCCGYNIENVSSWRIKPQSSISIDVICNAIRKAPGSDKRYITILSNSVSSPQIEIPVTSYIIKSQVKTSKDKLFQQKAPQILHRTKQPSLPSMSPQELNNKIEKGYLIFTLDVREPTEYSEKYINRALTYPRSKFYDDQQGLIDLLRNIDKRTPLVVYCGGGIRSSYITGKLRSWGYNAYNLEGGLSAWEKEGYGLVHGPKLPSTQQPLPIEAEEAYDYYYTAFKDKTIWIDARDRNDFQRSHIKGAINIPVDEIEKNISTIPNDKEIVLYCSGPDCDSSVAAGRILISGGFKQGKVKVYRGGLQEWASRGYPVE